jgi:hypothetical protein
MNNEAPPLYPTVKMESAIGFIQRAIELYDRGSVKQPGFGYEEYMEEVKRNLRWAISDINYAYAMIEPMPAGEPIPEDNAMKPNAGAEGGRRWLRSANRASTRRLLRSAHRNRSAHRKGSRSAHRKGSRSAHRNRSARRRHRSKCT